MHDFSETIGKKVRLAQIWSLLAVGLLGLAVAIAAWTALSVWEERLARAKFNDTAGDYATVIQSGLDEYLDKIRALGAFFDASDSIDATEFGLFTTKFSKATATPCGFCGARAWAGTSVPASSEMRGTRA